MTPLTVGAFVVAILLLWGLISIVKTTFKTALIVAVIVFGLQVFTGVGPQQVFQQVLLLIGGIAKWFSHWGGSYKTPEGFRGKESIIWFLQFLPNIASID